MSEAYGDESEACRDVCEGKVGVSEASGDWCEGNGDVREADGGVSEGLLGMSETGGGMSDGQSGGRERCVKVRRCLCVELGDVLKRVDGWKVAVAVCSSSSSWLEMPKGRWHTEARR